MKVKAEPWGEERGAKGIIAKGNTFLILKGDGSRILRSTDGGMTWKAHPLGIERPLGRSFGMSIVGDEFWITGNNAKASKDGINWRDLPETLMGGRIEASDKGTLISVHRKRHGIHRSEDGGKTWKEVYKFTPDPKAKGGAQGFGDVAFGRVSKVK